MRISVVIPTCNRKKNLLLLLADLNQSAVAIQEIIVVDSGEDVLNDSEIASFSNLNIFYKPSEKSVCVQRNIGIQTATSEWIFLCDDDIEMPADYLLKLKKHLQMYTEAGAASGIILQKNNNQWVGNYPIKSNSDLLFRYIFKLSIWGPLANRKSNFFSQRITRYYLKKGNHLSIAGWPVITNFSGDYFESPVYGLGASLIKKEWLLQSPFDETLDRHGIGDNYGLAARFSGKVHIVNNAFVYHHQEIANRLQHKLAYYRRILAIDYFRQTISSLKFIKKNWLIWSLVGNALQFTIKRNFFLVYPTLKAILKIMMHKNDYLQASLQNKKITEPIL